MPSTSPCSPSGFPLSDQLSYAPIRRIDIFTRHPPLLTHTLCQEAGLDGSRRLEVLDHTRRYSQGFSDVKHRCVCTVALHSHCELTLHGSLTDRSRFGDQGAVYSLASLARKSDPPTPTTQHSNTPHTHEDALASINDLCCMFLKYPKHSLLGIPQSPLRS